MNYSVNSYIVLKIIKSYTGKSQKSGGATFLPTPGYLGLWMLEVSKIN